MQCKTSNCFSRKSLLHACLLYTHSIPNSTGNTSILQASIPVFIKLYAFWAKLVLSRMESAIIFIFGWFFIKVVRFSASPVSTLHFCSFRNFSLVISNLLFLVEPQGIGYWHILDVSRRLRHQILIVYYEYLKFIMSTSWDSPIDIVPL